jgi:hypothetical protein
VARLTKRGHCGSHQLIGVQEVYMAEGTDRRILGTAF